MIYKGNPVSAGIAIGSAFVYDPKILTAPEDAPVLPMECELERYENAVQAAQAKLREIQAAFTGKDDDKAEIFSAHLDMVDDEEISEEIRSAIHAGTGAAKAVEQVYQRYADLLAALDDDFMVQRAHDLLDVQQRLLRILLGALEQNLSRLDGPVPGLFRIAAKLLGLPFQRKAIIVSDAAIEIGFHRVVPPIPQPVPGRS